MSEVVIGGRKHRRQGHALQTTFEAPCIPTLLMNFFNLPYRPIQVQFDEPVVWVGHFESDELELVSTGE